jgi:predicted methyltransferase
MSSRFALLVVPTLLGLAGCAASSMQSATRVDPAVIAAAVADSARPEADRTRDGDRKPADVIAFAGMGPGSKIGELAPGGGYFTRIFSKTVGANGVVYALVPPRPPNAPAPAQPPPINALASDAHYGNIRLATLDPAASLPEAVDYVWTSLNYHDMHNRPNADLMAFNKMAFNALKPGGTYIVIDHAAADGSGKRDTGTLHRIDPALVRSEVLAAGFEFVGESTVLRNPEDDRSKGVRDVSRGKTDQFVFKFRRPK